MLISDFTEELKGYENILGFNPLEAKQGSDNWLKMKLGVISASKAKELLMKDSSKTKQTYLCSLVSEISTGFKDEIGAKALDWGIMNEDGARMAYEFWKGDKVVELPFIYGDRSMRYGISPDGLVTEGERVLKGCEIKCPWNPTNFIKFVCNDDIKKEHELQCQFSMYVTGLYRWDYANYDPRMRKNQIHVYSYERDELLMKTFHDAVPSAVEKIDNMLDQLGIKFGEQWSN